MSTRRFARPLKTREYPLLCPTCGLFPVPKSECPRCGDTQLCPVGKLPRPRVVWDLETLICEGHKFKTVLADPPWRLLTAASQAADKSESQSYPDDYLHSLPIQELVEDNAHLHLWTSDDYLERAFGVIRAWGFEFECCMVWVNPASGIDNYWQVSHQFMLLGVRGELPFGQKDIPSWLRISPSIHSQKPPKFRELIEQVSPAPYLELFGREEQANTDWTVFGDQVGLRLF